MQLETWQTIRLIWHVCSRNNDLHWQQAVFSYQQRSIDASYLENFPRDEDPPKVGKCHVTEYKNSFIHRVLIFLWFFFTAQCTLVQMRGLGIACRPSVRLSVRPSVTLVDCNHIRWKSWKVIARTISHTPSLFVTKRRSPIPRGTWGNLGETRSGVGKKWQAGEQKRQYLRNA